MEDSTSIPSPKAIGLTPVHLAVLRDDLGQLITLIKSKEHGIDALDARKASPIMLAALAGRSTAFLFLLENGASRERKDIDGKTVFDYLLLPISDRLAHMYQSHAKHRFSEKRRKVLRAFWNAISKSKSKDPSDTEATVVDVSPQASAPAPAPMDQEAPAKDRHETKEVIVHQNNTVMFGTLSIHLKAEFDVDAGTKTTGAIRGRAEGSPFHAMAMSGWSGSKAEGCTVLCNTTYTLLVKEVSGMYGLPVRANPCDYLLLKNPPPGMVGNDFFGLFYCCHTERQLATWLVKECISRALGKDRITIENVSQLKKKLDVLPLDLRETVIELSHRPCTYCIEYINLLQKKSGLVMGLKFRPWFNAGKRKKLKRVGADHVRNVSMNAVVDDDDVFTNEIGDDDIQIIVDDSAADVSNSTNVFSVPEQRPLGPRAPRRKPAGRSKHNPVDTERMRRGPSIHIDPTAADESSENNITSSPPVNATSSTAANGTETSPTPRRASRPYSFVSRGSDRVLTPTPHSSADMPDTEERARKRRRQLDSFKDIVISFAHVSDSSDSEPQEQEAPQPSEGLLDSLAVAEPFPGADAFAHGNE